MAANQSPTFKVGDGMVTDNVITTGVLDWWEIPRPIQLTSNQHFFVQSVAYALSQPFRI